jgi:hypothetical protein
MGHKKSVSYEVQPTRATKNMQKMCMKILEGIKICTTV